MTTVAGQEQRAAAPAPALDSVALPGTGWSLWRDVALRSTGFPAERVGQICDVELSAAADGLDGTSAAAQRYAQEYSAATGRLSAAIREVAADARFREAVTWQNPALIRDCLDKAVAGEPRNVRGRNHELTITSYLQRYSLKNDTIGFFGPVGWARFVPQDVGLTSAPGPKLLGRRTTYFEGWAVDAVAEAIAERPEVWPWLCPRPEPSTALTGWTLRRPFRKPVKLSAQEVKVLGRCDGRRTVRDIAGSPPNPSTMSTLLRLRDCGAVRIDLRGTLVSRPERELGGRLAAIPDKAARTGALEMLEELVAGRDAVASAAGDPDRLVAAGSALAGTFERLTGSASTRRAGRAYAGRTLVFEDTVRADTTQLGRRVSDALAAPLGLLLDSARWLMNSLAQRYLDLARAIMSTELTRTGARSMPLLQLLTTVMPELGQLGYGLTTSSADDPVIADFQRRWQRVLAVPDDPATRSHRVASTDIAAGVAREFATGRPLWSGARWYSPDVMVAARDREAAARGDVDLVLGELHCASNTMENQLFVAQHPQSQRLRDNAAAIGLDHRVVVVPRGDSLMSTSRMSRAAEMLLPDYTYLCLGEESLTPPPGATVVSIIDMAVRPRGEDLVVTCRTGGPEYDFLEMIGDPLTALTVDAFTPFEKRPHRPRVSIDRLVVGRESWTFAAADMAWVDVKDEARRFAEARRWRADHGLPERTFVRVPVERKPMAVDLRSLPLVNLFAKSIRRTAATGPSATFTLTEMLPDVDELWLHDVDGASYTAEFRMVAVSTGADSPSR